MTKKLPKMTKQNQEWYKGQFCHNHNPPMPFKECDVVVRLDENGKVNAKGKYTKSVCTLKKKHPHHLHCSVKSCTKVTRLKHPSYTNEHKRNSRSKTDDKKMIQDLLTAKKAQEKREE